MKLMFDLDPKLVKKLEVVSQAKKVSVPDLVTELMTRVLTRESASSSSEGLPSPATVEAIKAAPVEAIKAAPVEAIKAAPPKPAPGMDPRILQLVLTRFRLSDADGTQRQACLTDLKKLPQDELTATLVSLIAKSLGK